MLDALTPAQQIGGLQGVKHVAPLLFLVGCVVVLATASKGVQFLVFIVGDLLLALPGKNLLAGANRAQAAALIGATLWGRLVAGGIFIGFIMILLWRVWLWKDNFGKEYLEVFEKD